MNKDTILGIVRHILTFGGGSLVTKGFADTEQTDQLIGALMTIIGVVWSIIHKRSTANIKVGILIACLLPASIGAAYGQTNGVDAPLLDLFPSNAVPVVVRIIDFNQGVSGSSNLNVAVYPSYAPDLINADGKSDQWGFGAALTYSFRGDVGRYLFAGLRVDYLGGEFWAPSIAGGLKADVQLFGHNVTPFAYTGAIVPLSGAGSLDGEWGVIYGTGLKTDVWKGKLFGKDARVGIGAAIERWDNFDGPVYHIAPVLSIKW